MVSIDGFVIDAMPVVEPTHTAEATRFPIEGGADVSDHVIQRPTILTIEGIVSDTPIGQVAITRANTTDTAAGTSVTPAAEAYERLKEIQVSARLVRIVTEVYPPFDNCALISLSARKDDTTGESFPFRAQFQVLQLVSVNVEARDTTVSVRRAKKKKPKGNTPVSTVPSDQDSKAKGRYQSRAASYVETLADWASGL